MDEFTNLNLHDSTLHVVRYEWSKKTLELSIQTSSVDSQSILTFSGCKRVNFTQTESWGPSSSINSTSYSNGVYFVELQSGDIIEIEANSFLFQVLN